MHELHQQTCCVKYTSLIPHQPVVPAGLPRWCLLTWQASVTWWVYNECMSTNYECMNFVNNIAHRILLHCQQKGWVNGFLPKAKRLFCGALAAGYQINGIATLRSVPFIRKTPWNQSLCPHYSPGSWKSRKLKTETDTETDGGNGNTQAIITCGNCWSQSSAAVNYTCEQTYKLYMFSFFTYLFWFLSFLLRLCTIHDCPLSHSAVGLPIR